MMCGVSWYFDIMREVEEWQKKNGTRVRVSGDDENEICPACGNRLTHESGCVYCQNCGWGKCG